MQQVPVYITKDGKTLVVMPSKKDGAQARIAADAIAKIYKTRPIKATQVPADAVLRK